MIECYESQVWGWDYRVTDTMPAWFIDWPMKTITLYMDTMTCRQWNVNETEI